MVFLMFSAVKHFKIYWFFFHFPHHTHTRTLTLFICHNEPSSPCGDLLREHAFSDNSQPYQCYPQQIHRGKTVAWCTFWFDKFLIDKVLLKINTFIKKSPITKPFISVIDGGHPTNLLKWIDYNIFKGTFIEFGKTLEIICYYVFSSFYIRSSSFIIL